MRTILGLMIIVVSSSLVGCAELKYRLKNYSGEKSEAQVQDDWKFCYEASPGRYAFNKCIEKKGYYFESYTE